MTKLPEKQPDKQNENDVQLKDTTSPVIKCFHDASPQRLADSLKHALFLASQKRLGFHWFDTKENDNMKQSAKAQTSDAGDKSQFICLRACDDIVGFLVSDKTCKKHQILCFFFVFLHKNTLEIAYTKMVPQLLAEHLVNV